MSGLSGNRRRAGRQTAALAAFLLVQSLAAVFFISDALTDLIEGFITPHLIIEGLVAVALAAGLVFGTVALRRTIEQMNAQAAALQAARGALAEVIEAQFADWGLTPAERDVAMLALKGLDVAEIASLRSAAQGTVRAQLSRVYTKAGVTGRAQFAAHFVEDLLAEGVPGQ